MEHILHDLSSIPQGKYHLFFEKISILTAESAKSFENAVSCGIFQEYFNNKSKSRSNTMNIAEIDKNYAVAAIEGYEITFYDVFKDAFWMLEGLPFAEKNQNFFRLPLEMMDKVSEGVSGLSRHTSGGALRFVSDTPALTIKHTPAYTLVSDNVPFTNCAGVDVYRRLPGEETFIHCGTPRFNRCNIEDMRNPLVCKNESGQEYEYLINFPRYGGLENFAVGIVTGSSFHPAPARKVAKPVVFYGSSITQGSAASRPGLHYTGRCCRAVDATEINYGYAGNAKGEEIMAEMISKLEMSAFILDYDHNAPTPEHLEATHSRFFKIIREKNPDLPVIMMNRPANWEFGDRSDKESRRAIVFNTFDEARKSGDKNVWFIDGESFFEGADRFDCTSDLTHPNDIGFERMYKKILPVLKEALGINS
jgi:hypothetical protein